MENKPNLFLYFIYYVLLLLLWKLTDVKKDFVFVNWTLF